MVKVWSLNETVINVNVISKWLMNFKESSGTWKLSFTELLKVSKKEVPPFSYHFNYI